MGVDLGFDRSIGLEDSCMNLAVSAYSRSGSVFSEFVSEVNLPIFRVNSSSPTDDDLIMSLAIANVASDVIGRVLN